MGTLDDDRPDNRGGAREGAGRPPKGDRPLPRSGFTAFAEQIVFYIILGGENTTSAGVQQAVDRLRALDEEAARTYRMAEYVVERSRQAVGNEVGETAVVRHARENLGKYTAEYARL